MFNMFKILTITLAIVVVVGWIAYGVWTGRERSKEKDKPAEPEQKREASKRLQEARSQVEDYARKLASFKRPTPPAKPEQDGTTGEE
jgi:FtsZ-interacting cell division protein ZipA